MTILEKLDQAIKEAAKSRDKIRLGAVRLIKSTVINKEKELKHPVEDAEFMSTLSGMARKVRESIEQFKKGGRTDLVLKEEGELAVIESFLPKPLSDDELNALVDKAIKKEEVTGPKQMGLVMKNLKEKTTGRVDGKKLANLVREKLVKISSQSASNESSPSPSLDMDKG